MALIAGALVIGALLAAPWPVAAMLGDLSPAAVKEAVDAGAESIVQDDFGEEWRVAAPDGAELAVTTPFSRLALASRQAALKGEPLGDKPRQEAVDRGKGRFQNLATMSGASADFTRWFTPVLLVGQQEVKATFIQNERTALRGDDNRFTARNVYVFPLEGLPLNGSVTLVVRHAIERRDVLRAPIDLSKMR